MRSLKFRVWDKRYKQYVEPYAICLDGRAISITEPNNDLETLDSERAIIEFGTGLKDKNGDKEIYENDIVSEEFKYGGEKVKTIWQVRWCDDECAFELHYVSGLEVDDCSLYTDDEENYEVIGNIHENPELLIGEEE